MSLLKFIKAQLGMSSTPANNFMLDASAQDGTMKLSRGNAGATTQDILVVDAMGRVSTPNNTVAFLAKRVASVQTFPQSTTTRINFDSVVFDTSGAYNSGLFKPTVPGYYIFNVSVNIETSSGVSRAFSTIAKYGTGGAIVEAVRIYDETGLYAPTFSGGTIFYLDGVNDSVDASLYITGSVRQVSYPSYFSGALIAKA